MGLPTNYLVEAQMPLTRPKRPVTALVVLAMASTLLLPTSSEAAPGVPAPPASLPAPGKAQKRATKGEKRKLAHPRRQRPHGRSQAYTGQGTIGFVAMQSGLCATNGGVTSIALRTLGTVAPAIYAADVTTGGGNDANWVRFRTYLTDYAGNILVAHPFSDFAQATDTQPAVFSGRQSFDNVPAYSKLVVSVEWWNSQQKLGWAAYAVPAYVWVQNNTTPQGSADACPA
jgi:hypothetical protein